MKFNQLKYTASLLLISVLCLLPLSACSKSKSVTATTVAQTSAKQSKYVRCDEASNLVMLKMADGSEIVMELAEDKAPITTDNFKN